MLPALFSYRPYWPHKLGTAPVLPMSQEEMELLGWDSCDIIIVTGDAYVDHPSFGMAVIGRLLEAQGFRVGIISQPDWQDIRAFTSLGRPKLFFGITSGNMDSMVNHYTSDRKIRHNDAYTPDAVHGKRPDRAVIVYAQRCREAFKDTPIILGGIEASLRRVSHYDYWSDQVRRAILFDAKADMLLFGNAERAITALAHRLARGEKLEDITDLRGSAFVRKELPQGYQQIDATVIDPPGRQIVHAQTDQCFVRLPSFEQVQHDPVLYTHTSRLLHVESNPGNARALVQRHGQQELWINPPPVPLTTAEMDQVFELPYTRRPHPHYAGRKISAYEMIRFSIIITRGCFGGCTFCSITEHEGRIIQNRSEASILREIETIRDTVPGFTGVISDLGGPTANMYRLHCKSKNIETSCRRLSCVYPKICANLNTNHQSLVQLYRKVREIQGVKKITIASGVRYDLAAVAPEYIKELVTHHVGGYLKIAPEHTEAGPLSKMMKPGIGAYERFKELFDRFSQEAGKEQYLIPYFIAAHPGTTDEDMLRLALWLKKNNFRTDQVQTFLPTPMALATAMYHSGKNPLGAVRRNSENVFIPKNLKQRQLHKALLRYHDQENWPMLRDALNAMGRQDLVGNSQQHLIPPTQPKSPPPWKKQQLARKFKFNR